MWQQDIHALRHQAPFLRAHLSGYLAPSYLSIATFLISLRRCGKRITRLQVTCQIVRVEIENVAVLVGMGYNERRASEKIELA